MLLGIISQINDLYPNPCLEPALGGTHTGTDSNPVQRHQVSEPVDPSARTSWETLGGGVLKEGQDGAVRSEDGISGRGPGMSLVWRMCGMKWEGGGQWEPSGWWGGNRG